MRSLLMHSELLMNEWIRRLNKFFMQCSAFQHLLRNLSDVQIHEDDMFIVLCIITINILCNGRIIFVGILLFFLSEAQIESNIVILINLAQIL